MFNPIFKEIVQGQKVGAWNQNNLVTESPNMYFKMNGMTIQIQMIVTIIMIKQHPIKEFSKRNA